MLRLKAPRNASRFLVNLPLSKFHPIQFYPKYLVPPNRSFSTVAVEPQFQATPQPVSPSLSQIRIAERGEVVNIDGCFAFVEKMRHLPLNSVVRFARSGVKGMLLCRAVR
jgi:hypothetical protein